MICNLTIQKWLLLTFADWPLSITQKNFLDDDGNIGAVKYGGHEPHMAFENLKYGQCKQRDWI